MRTKRFFVISLLVLASLALAACGVIAAQAGSQPPISSDPIQVTSAGNPRILSVSGRGQVTLSPDLAYVTIGVRSENAEAKAAVDANNTQTQAVVDALLAFGIDQDDIQTLNFNIYSYEDFNQPFDEKPPLKYSVENSVYVTVRDIDGLGDLLSAAIDAGANNIWGVQFDVADKTEALSDARALAVENANEKAAELAGLAEVELGQILSISASGGGNYPTPYGVGGGGLAVAEESAAVPVSPGQINVSVEVSIVFEIQ